MRLLIAEDETGISDAVARGLRREGMAVDVAFDGREALYKARVVDYLAKPFAFAELVARVRALARRDGRTRPERLERAGMKLDPARHVASRDGRVLDLSPKEFAVLRMLMEADGAVVSMQELLERGWDENADPWTNTVRMTIMTLRRKLGDPPVLETVKGAGYRI